MKIKNTNNQKAFIVKAEHILEGGELSPDGMTSYINPGATVDIDDEVGQKLADTYENIMVVEKAKLKKKV